MLSSSEVVSSAHGCRLFTLGELWVGVSAMKCVASCGCVSPAYTLVLSAHEVERINNEFPAEVEEGLARGSKVSNFISTNSLGKPYCDEHLPNF